MPDLGSIQGATALKLENEIEDKQSTLINNNLESKLNINEDMTSGVSLENASYFENELDDNQVAKKIEPEETIIDEISLFEEKPIDNLNTKSENEVSPQLFSDDDITNSSSESNPEEFLKNEEEEDFEIPAFLRKQKY